jgi:DNA-binding response OmpR family regulator
LITDFVLGHGLNGIDLATAARAERPELPALLLIGAGEALPHGGSCDGMHILAKPFDHAGLVRAVRAAKRLANQQSGYVAGTPALGP